MEAALSSRAGLPAAASAVCRRFLTLPCHVCGEGDQKAGPMGAEYWAESEAQQLLRGAVGRGERRGGVDAMVCRGETRRDFGKREIVVDSGAAESVCPWDWATEVPTKKVAWNPKRNLLNASGGRMEHYGDKKVCCEFEGLSTPMSVECQVSIARNRLASVARITDIGNIVQFTPKDKDNYIFNPRQN